MKKYLKYMLLVPAALMLAVSCYEDKGNYDYNDVREAYIDIPLVDEYKGVLAYDWFKTMTLDPQVTLADGTKANDSDYDYEWNIYMKNPVQNEDGSYPPKKKIGESRAISYYLEDIPGNYYVALSATNKHTTAVTDYRFEVTIQAINGWMVLEEDASGNMDLGMIRDKDIIPGLLDEQAGVEHNLYATANEGAKLHGVEFLSQVNNNWGTYYNIYAFTADGFYKIDPRSFQLKTNNFSTMFSLQPTNYKPQAHYAYHPQAGRLDVMLNDGAFYYIRWNMMGQRDIYGTPATGAFSVIYRFAPFLAPIPWGGSIVNVLYNDTYNPSKKSFVAVNQFGALTFVSTPDATKNAFNTGNIDAAFIGGVEVPTYNFQPVFIGTGTNGVTCGVFRDEYDNGARWLLVADFRDAAEPLARMRKKISGLPGIPEATHFVFGIRGDVMFYATPAGVYSYLYTDETAQPKLILPLSGETVSSLKLYQHYQNENYTGRILMVGTNSGNTGKVYKVHFNELSGALGEKGVTTYTGFGNVVDMYIKE